MSKAKLVVTRWIFPEILAKLTAQFEVQANQEDQLLAPSELIARAREAEALFVVTSDKIDQALLDQCPRLRIIATGSVGFNHIDLAACVTRGIGVTNTPDVLTQSTADMAWTLMMACARRVSESERYLREGKWERWAFNQFLGQDVYGSTLGIVGMGRIGSALAQRASGFNMRVLYNNRSRASNEAEMKASWVSLPELLKLSDHVILVLPYSSATHHLIGASELEQMKSSATLVNIARGGVVNDLALIAALKAQRIFAAGLDVFENEPRFNPEFLSLSNVVLTPHIGSSTLSTRTQMVDLAAQNLLAWVKSEPLLTALT
jgi:glyoxylate/hydroxypyruvate/2-ketogluconate reductase